MQHVVSVLRIRSTALLWCGWIFFVVYGSLLPFDFQPLALDQAIDGFRHIPFLVLGIESRADWVANGVLYVPVGLLSARLLLAVFRGRAWPLAMMLAVGFGALLAICIEFAQQYFPPRTVSQNDLIAEFIGTAIGAIVAPVLSRWTGYLLGAWGIGGQRLAQRLLEGYALAYLLLSFFPYDLLLTAQEWGMKLGSDNCGWLLAGVTMQRGWLAGVLLAVEITMAIPYGLLLASRYHPVRIGAGAALILGSVLGLTIELGQLAVASGISQGISVLTRGVGVALGAWCWRLWIDGGIAPIRAALGRHATTFGIIYSAIVLAVNGWFSHPLLGIADLPAKWAGLRLMPLYYHYYTTEAIALFSLGSVALMYLPVALIGWSRQWQSLTTIATATTLAIMTETGKLLLDGLRPDPTNLIIAPAACWAALHLLDLVARPAPIPGCGQSAGANPVKFSPSRKTDQDVWAWAVTGPILAFAALSAWRLPALAWPVLIVLAASAALVWRWPVLGLALIPAALPIFDLAPWTGRFYWDEFDLLLLVVFTIGWHRTTQPTRTPGGRKASLNTAVLVVLGVALVVSTFKGLVPWQWPDLNAFSSYYSAFNALRITKGAVWAFGFAMLYRRLRQSGVDKFAVFAWGMSAGLLLTVAVVIWERLAFVGLLDFGNIYRVTGPFSAMHTGGAYIECYLAVATAFLLWLVVRTPRAMWRWLGTLLLLGTTYSLMVTYSRNGYAALFVVVLVMLGTTMIRPARHHPRRVAAAVVSASMLVVALPVLLGPFALQRLTDIGRDQAIRVAHWKDALQMRDDSWTTMMFGVGMGRFPATHYWQSAEPVHAAPFSLEKEQSGTFLRLGVGAPVYIEQFVDAKPGQRYRLSLDVRSEGSGGLGVALCEKWMLTSGACDHVKLDVIATPGEWHHTSATFTTEKWASHAWYRAPPVKLAFFNSNGPSTIEITNISLASEAGADLLSNSSFSAGMDRWFFSTDVDPPWHIHSLPVSILFEQGWLGLLAWTLALVAATAAAAVRAWRRSPVAAPVLAALLAMMVSGVANTLIDAPRFMTMLLVLLWLASLSDDHTTSSHTNTNPNP